MVEAHLERLSGLQPNEELWEANQYMLYAE